MNSRRLIMRPMVVEDAHFVAKWYMDQAEKYSVTIGDGNPLKVWQDKIINQKNDEKLLVFTDLKDQPIGCGHYHSIQNKSCHVAYTFDESIDKDLQKEGMQFLLAFLMGTLGIKMAFMESLDLDQVLEKFLAIGFEKTGVIKGHDGQDNKALLTLTLDSFKKALNQPFKVI